MRSGSGGGQERSGSISLVECHLRSTVSLTVKSVDFKIQPGLPIGRGSEWPKPAEDLVHCTVRRSHRGAFDAETLTFELPPIAALRLLKIPMS